MHARVERVDDAPPEQVPRHWRRGKKQAPRDPRGGTLGVARRGLAEQQPESWPGGTKLRRRGHRQVHLQRVGEQEHAVGGRATLEVGKVHRIELVDERARPGIEHRSDRHVVLLREPEQLLAERMPLRNGEHEAGVYRCR
jgi:hypothetical protein